MKRRFTLPWWRPEQRRWASRVIAERLARAQILADTFRGRWAAGIPAAEFKEHSTSLRARKRKLHWLLDQKPDVDRSVPCAMGWLARAARSGFWAGSGMTGQPAIPLWSWMSAPVRRTFRCFGWSRMDTNGLPCQLNRAARPYEWPAILLIPARKRVARASTSRRGSRIRERVSTDSVSHRRSSPEGTVVPDRHAYPRIE